MHVSISIIHNKVTYVFLIRGDNYMSCQDIDDFIAPFCYVVEINFFIVL